MGKINKKLKNKKLLICIIIVILVVLIRLFNQKEPEQEKSAEIETIEKRNIATSISATGKITTENTQNAMAALSGVEVSSVNVKEGDVVSVRRCYLYI